MKKVLTGILLALCLGTCSPKESLLDYPQAEWDPARVILMHTPGQELFNGVIHSSAGLFEDYFDIDKAAEEHLGYIRLNAKPGEPEYVTCDIWTREPGTLAYSLAQQDLSFVDYLRSRGFQIIPIDYADEMHYANNFLTIGPRHIMAVGGQSEAMQQRFRDAGVHVEWIPLESLIAGYGAAHCMTQVLRRERKGP